MDFGRVLSYPVQNWLFSPASHTVSFCPTARHPVSVPRQTGWMWSFSLTRRPASGTEACKGEKIPADAHTQAPSPPKGGPPRLASQSHKAWPAGSASYDWPVRFSDACWGLHAPQASILSLANLKAKLYQSRRLRTRGDGTVWVGTSRFPRPTARTHHHRLRVPRRSICF